MEDIELKAEELLKGYDPSEEPLMEFERIPDGTYTGVIEKIEWRKSEQKGTPFVMLTILIDSGEYENRKEFISYFFTKKTAKWSARRLMHLAYTAGSELQAAHFASMDTIVEALNETIFGKLVEFTKVTKNDFPNFDLKIRG